MSKNQSDTIVLSYYDCVLRKADVHLLLGQDWINDALIEFYFEYLGKKLESSNSSEILYASPVLTQLLKLTDSSELSIFLDPLDGLKKKYIFFPLNNNKSVSAGGSHWSLLVFSKGERTFFHFDSLALFNQDNIARGFAKNIERYLLGEELGKFVESSCPQQANGTDCGLFVLCISDVLTEHILRNSKAEGYNLENVKKMVPGKRQSLLELIETLKVS